MAALAPSSAKGCAQSASAGPPPHRILPLTCTRGAVVMYTVYSNNILREVPMDRNTPSSQPEKNIRLPDKALLWIVAFAGFGLLCLILVFVLKPWVLKVLFLLLLAGTAGYLWVMIQSRRIAPAVSLPMSVPLGIKRRMILFAFSLLPRSQAL